MVETGGDVNTHHCRERSKNTAQRGRSASGKEGMAEPGWAISHHRVARTNFE